jgi:ABC-type antimicrobial peptide transport system permease subunit
MREIRLTVRSLARTPLYTLTAIASLALGIGATTAIFSMMDRVLLRTLPVKEPDRLAFLYHPGPLQGSSSTSEQGGPAFSYPMFREMQAQQTAFTALAGSYNVAASAAYNNAAANARALLVSGNYFQVLGAGSAMGRVFQESDDGEAGAHPLVVLSHGYWRSRFGADPGMLNQTMIVNGHANHDLRERLAALPGVTSATGARVAAIAGSNSSGNMTVEGFTPKGDGDDNSRFNEVGPDYFRTMGIPLIAGREFSESDRAGAPKVAVVNEAFVRHFIPNRPPIGTQVMRGSDTKIKYDTTIVGVVKDAVYSNMREAPVPVYYSASAQARQQRNMNFYVRTVADPLQAASAVRGAVASFDPNLPVVNLRTMQAQIDANVANERLLSLLTGTFAGLATLLAAVGLYGVLAFNVARRTREIGIRMALGAGAAQVRRLVVREVLVIIGIGTALGLTAAWFAGTLVQSVLFDTKPADPWIFASAAAALGIIALAAAYIPVRRATGVDPMIALRYE